MLLSRARALAPSRRVCGLSLEQPGGVVSRRWPSFVAGFPGARKRTPTQQAARDVFGFVLAVATLVALFYSGWKLIFSPNQYPLAHPMGETDMVEASFPERCGEARPRPFVIRVVYGPDLAEWIEPAATRYMHDCPNSQIKLQAMKDIDAVRAIAAGEIEPTLWIPRDRSMLTLLEARWTRDAALAVDDGPALVRTPMVMLMWKDRLDALDAALPAGLRGKGGWSGSVCAGIPTEPRGLHPDPGEGKLERDAMVPISWAELRHEPRLAGWGRVRVDHASPSDSSVGLLGLTLVARDYAQSRGHSLEDLEDFDRLGADFQRWLERCEAGLPQPKATGRLLTETMFNLGDPGQSSNGSDGVISTEQLAFSVLTRIDAHEAGVEAVRIVYPDDTAQLDHPALFLALGEHDEGAVAQRFVDVLLGEEQQARALELGFRPANPEVSLRSYDAGPNPFLRLRRHGVELELDIAETLGEVIEDEVLAVVMARWQDATGRE